MQANWKVKKKSRIAALPRVIQPMAVVAREVYVRWIQKAGPGTYPHKADGIATKHIVDFKETKRFKRAYARAVAAGGFDYGIPFRVHQALWCNDLAQRVEGDYVELGTGRGFMMSALLEDLPTWNESGRSLWLFDTFSPFKLDEDGSQTEASERSRYYAESADATRENFAQWDGVNVVEGDVYTTLPLASIEKVAFLHLDLNHGAAEKWALRALFEKLQVGAVVLMDDYAFCDCEEQHQALNEIANELGLSILTTATGQGIAIR